jgi:hypothetical protein
MDRFAHDPLARAVREALTPDLLKSEYANGDRPFAGHCYVASEAYWHLSGGPDSGLAPTQIRMSPTVVHWWLVDRAGNVIDLTAEQFDGSVPYEKGRGCGFQTVAPSKRAEVVIARVLGGHPELWDAAA